MADVQERRLVSAAPSLQNKTTIISGRILEDTGYLPRYITLHHTGFLRSNVIPKNYDSYVPDCYSDILPLTKDNIKDILKKEAPNFEGYRKHRPPSYMLIKRYTGTMQNQERNHTARTIRVHR